MPNKRNTKASVPRKRLIKEEEEVKTAGGGFFKEAASIALFGLGIFLFLALYSYVGSLSNVAQVSGSNVIPSENTMGRAGFFLARFLFEHLGYCSFSVILCFFLLAYVSWRSDAVDDDGEKIEIFSAQRITVLSLFTVLLIISFATLSSTIFGYDGGGYLGTLLSLEFSKYLNKGGTVLFGVASVLIAFGVILNIRITHYIRLFKMIFSGAQHAAIDTGHALKIGAKAGGECLRKVPGVLPFKSRTNDSLSDEEEDDDYIDQDEYEDDEYEEDEDVWQLDDDEDDNDEEDDDSDRMSNAKVLSGKNKNLGRPSKKKPKAKRISKKWSLGESSEVEEEDADEEYCEEEDEDIDTDEDEVEEDIAEEDEVEEEVVRPLISRGEKIPNASQKSGLTPKPTKKNSPKPDPASVGGINNSRGSRGSRGDREYENYQLPPRELLVGLDVATVPGPDDDELLQNSRRLEQALKNFKLGGKVVEVHPGPIVTLYQFEPAAGIKVQRVISLADDLALALKVESVRVYAPVPGKGTVGIEVPNAEREIVRLRDVIDSEEYQSRPYSLSLALGKDTYGDAFVADLAKMPHLLIAGATGTGKSVCINSLLMSLLYRNSPSDLRLILIDPKMLELSTYESIPHLLSPVVTNPKRARGVLYWAVEEMERRYALMKDLGVRDLAMFNRAVSEKSQDQAPVRLKTRSETVVISLEEKDVVSTTAAKAMIERNAEGGSEFAIPANTDLSPMPRIVIVVDELADLMLTVGREIEELLTRLAQKARAAGIHLILATQRPSVNVITGLIKANFPARISFKVASKIDARTVMDQSGAERLLGQGDMLFLSPSVGRVKRLHSPFVSDQEVHDAVSWIRDQGRPDYDPEIERVLRVMEESEGKTGSMDSDDPDGYDPLYDQAVNLVLEKGQASTSMVQRVFRIGYNRAARILEVMEREGVVGPADGAKPRQVLGSSQSSMI